MIKCKICCKEFNTIHSLGIHLKVHKITSNIYYDRYFRNYTKDEGFCLECGKEVSFKNLNRGYVDYCSQKCRANNESFKKRWEKSILIKYGKKHPWLNKQIQEKRKETLFKKYKTICPANSKNSKNWCLDYNKISNKVKCTKEKRNQIGSKNNLPLFDFYSPKIDWVEETRKTQEGYLEVRCKKCNTWFIPKLNDLIGREQALKGNRGFSENNLYCSNECKNSCSIFGQRNYQRNQNPNSDRPWHSEWALEVKRIANYECEICGSKFNLTAHHIQPVKTHPYLQADIDNGICLCKECHGKYGHKDECSTGNLARMIC